jgi:hypothetical protein
VCAQGGTSCALWHRAAIRLRRKYQLSKRQLANGYDDAARWLHTPHMFGQAAMNSKRCSKSRATDKRGVCQVCNGTHCTLAWPQTAASKNQVRDRRRAQNSPEAEIAGPRSRKLKRLKAA